MSSKRRKVSADGGNREWLNLIHGPDEKQGEDIINDRDVRHRGAGNSNSSVNGVDEKSIFRLQNEVDDLLESIRSDDENVELDADHVNDMLESLVSRILCTPSDSMLDFALYLFELKSLEIDPKEIDLLCDKLHRTVVHLDMILNMVAETDDIRLDSDNIIAKCHIMIRHYNRTLLQHISMQTMISGGTTVELEEFIVSIESPSIVDQIIKIVSNHAFLRQRRWSGKVVYERITYEQAGRRIQTSCFRPILMQSKEDRRSKTGFVEISIFITSIIREETYPFLFSKMGKSLLESVIWKIQNYNPRKFPRLLKNRFHHGFRNGILDLNQLRFLKHTTSAVDSPCRYHDMQFPPDLQLHLKRFLGFMNQKISTDAKRNASVFQDELKNIQSIHCDGWDTVLNVQNKYWKTVEDKKYRNIKKLKGIGVIDWFYAFMGRILLPRSDLWQCIPWLIGQSGTGKSEILGAFGKYVFDGNNVGSVGNKIQETFEYANMAQRSNYVITIPEITPDWNFDMGTLQSMIGGDPITCAVKNQQESDVYSKFEPHMIAASNLLPTSMTRTDNKGSVDRRMAFFEFKVAVIEKKVLADHFSKGVPAFLVRAIATYKLIRRWMEISGRSATPQYYLHTCTKITAYEYLVPPKIRQFFETLIIDSNRQITAQKIVSAFKHFVGNPNQTLFTMRNYFEFIHMFNFTLGASEIIIRDGVLQGCSLGDD